MKKILLLVMLCLSVLVYSQSKEEFIKIIEENNVVVEMPLTENNALQTQLKESTEQLKRNNEILERAFQRIETDGIEIAELRALLEKTSTYVKQKYYTLYVFGGFDGFYSSETNFIGGLGFNIKVGRTPLNFMFKADGSVQRIGLSLGLGYSF